MNIVVKHIDDLTVKELRKVRDIAIKSLDFEKMTFSTLISHIEMIAIALDDREDIVGICSVKNPSAEYKSDIFLYANRYDVEKIHTHELGYMWVNFLHRRKGLSSQMIEALSIAYYERFPYGKLFATVKYDNEASINSLVKGWFQISVSKSMVENFVNIKSGNVLKLLLHRKKHFLSREEEVKEVPTIAEEVHEEIKKVIKVRKSLDKKRIFML